MRTTTMMNPDHRHSSAYNDTDPLTRKPKSRVRKFMAGASLVGAGVAAGLGVGLNVHNVGATAPETSVPAETPTASETLSPEEERAQIEREVEQMTDELAFAMLDIADSPKSHQNPPSEGGALTNYGDGATAARDALRMPEYHFFVTGEELYMSISDPNAGLLAKPVQDPFRSISFTDASITYTLSADALGTLREGRYLSSTSEVRALIDRGDTKVKTVMARYRDGVDSPPVASCQLDAGAETTVLGDSLDDLRDTQPKVIAYYSYIEAQVK